MSVKFAHAFSQGNNTQSALPGVLTSLPFALVGNPIPDEVETLAESLSAAGFATSGISTNPFISRLNGYSQGFDVFRDPSDAPNFLVENLLQIISTLIPGPAYARGRRSQTVL